MYTDPISDLLTRIRNAQNAHHQSVSVPFSKIKENILKVMKSKGFITSFSTETVENHKELQIELDKEKGSLNIKRVSKPGQRIYVKHKELKPVKSGLGYQIISTPQGVMCNVDAKKQNLGGEVLCEIYY